MQPLKDLLSQTIGHLHAIVEPPVFIEICREFWDRMGQVKLLRNGLQRLYRLFPWIRVLNEFNFVL